MVTAPDWAPESSPNDVEVQLLAEIRAELESDWQAKRGTDIAIALESSLGFIPQITRVLNAHTKLPLTELQPLCQLILDIILAAEIDLAALVRWCIVLKQTMRRYVLHEMEWQVQWRPLLKLLHATLLDKSRSYISPVLREHVLNSLPGVISALRHFFPPGSAAEIWAEFSPALTNYHCDDAYEALSQLALFMPMVSVSEGGATGDWGAWAHTWMELWDSVVHCRMWDTLWLYLFARLAKHDTHGLVDWGSLLPKLFTHVNWVFGLPIGGSTADPVFALSRVATTEVYSRHCWEDAGRLAIYLLDRVPLGAPEEVDGIPTANGTAEHGPNANGCAKHGPNANGRAEHGGGDAALAHLQTLTALMDTYFHPSNSGTWTSPLAAFLNKLSHSFLGLLAPKVRPQGKARGPPGGRGERRQQRQPKLPQETKDGMVDIFIRLASNAMYSKSDNMSQIGIDVLCDAAYLDPDKALPLICTRFEVALDNVSAHQLNTAIQSLSTAVRPVLMVGLPSPPNAMDIDATGDASDESLARLERATQMIAGSLEALLPAIDANDEEKSLLCLNYFCLVLSSLPAIPESGQPGLLPLDLEVWADAVVARCLVLLEAMETPDNRSADRHSGADTDTNCSFLLASDHSLFRPMLELLFARLAPSALKRIMNRLAKWVTSTTLPSVDLEAGTILAAAAAADPKLGAQLLVEPLLSRLEAELKSVAASTDHDRPEHQLSKVQQASLRWHLYLLRYAWNPVGRHLVPLAPRITAVLRSAFAQPSKVLQTGASDLLADLLNSTAWFYPTDTYHPCNLSSSTPSFEPCCDKLEWAKHPPPTWHRPSREEEALNAALLDDFLMQPAAALVAAAMDEGVAASWMTSRAHIRSLLFQMLGVLSGALTCIPDLSGYQDEVGCRIGPQLGMPAARQAVIDALVAIIPVMPASDFETLLIAGQVAEMAVDGSYLLRGILKEQDALLDCAYMYCSEPPASNLLDKEATGKWRNRLPRWIQVERSRSKAQWRAVGARKYPGVTPSRPVVPLADVPPAFRALLEVLLPKALAPFGEGRAAAQAALQRLLKMFPNALAPLLLPPLLLAVCGATEKGDGKPVICEAGVSQQLLERLLSDMPSSKGAPTDDVALDGLVLGAVAALQMQPLWRLMARDPTCFAAASAAMVAACREGSRAHNRAVSGFVAFRLIQMTPPPRAAHAQAGSAGQGPAQMLIRQLLDMVKPSPAGTATPQPTAGTVTDGMHWRKALVVDAQLTLLAPLMPPHLVPLHVSHMMATLLSDITNRRTLATFVLPALLQTTYSDGGAQLPDSGSSVRSVVREAIQQPDYVQRVLALASHIHPASSADSKGGEISIQGSKDENAVTMLGAYFWCKDGWPHRRSGVASTFSTGHARMWQALATAAPAEATAALREPLAAALQGSQSDDRPIVLAATEAIAGLLASGAPFAETSDMESETVWQSWLGAMLRGALDSAPLEMADSWATAVRFGLYALCCQAHSPSDPNGSSVSISVNDSIQHLFDLTLPPASNGNEQSSSSVIKRLRLMHQMLLELSTQPNVPAQGTDTTTSSNGIGASGRNDLLPAARKFLESVFQELPSLAALPSASLQEEVAIVAAAACALAMMTSPSGSPPVAAADAFCSSVERTLVESAQILQSLEGNGSNTSHGNGSISSPPDEVPAEGRTSPGSGIMGSDAVARLGLALAFVKKVLVGGDGALLRHHLLRYLPPLLLLQELKLPELQRLQLLSRTALAMIKQLPMGSSPAAAQAAHVVSLTAKAPLWTARASALGWTQVFWFRHVFLLPSHDSVQLQVVVERLLSDGKVEVANLAAATLTGFLRAASPTTATASRQKYLAAAKLGRPKKRRHAAKTTEATADGGEAVSMGRHAAVLGLKAAAACAPYDVPQWLPDILVALAGAAAESAPTGRAARAALADFRRTHEPGVLAEARQLLGDDGWEAITEIEGGREGGFA